MRFQPKRLAVIFFVLLLATACTSNREPAPQPEITNPEQEISEDGPATTTWYDLPEPCRLLRYERPSLWRISEEEVKDIYTFEYGEGHEIIAGTFHIEGDEVEPLQIRKEGERTSFWAETILNHPDTLGHMSWYYDFSLGEDKRFKSAYFAYLDMADAEYGISARFHPTGRLDSLNFGAWQTFREGKVVRTDAYGNLLEIKFTSTEWDSEEKYTTSTLLEYDTQIKSPLYGNYIAGSDALAGSYEMLFSPHVVTKLTHIDEAGNSRARYNLHYEVDSLGYASACYKADGSLVYRVEIEAP